MSYLLEDDVNRDAANASLLERTGHTLEEWERSFDVPFENWADDEYIEILQYNRPIAEVALSGEPQRRKELVDDIVGFLNNQDFDTIVSVHNALEDNFGLRSKYSF